LGILNSCVEKKALVVRCDLHELNCYIKRGLSALSETHGVTFAHTAIWQLVFSVCCLDR